MLHATLTRPDLIGRSFFGYSMLLATLPRSFSSVPSIEMFGNENIPREIFVYIDESIVEAPTAETYQGKTSTYS